MDHSLSNNISAFLELVRNTEQSVNMSIADEQELNNQTQDILHALELDKHTYHEMARLSKTLAQVRRKRRGAKDTIEIGQILLNWAENNKQAVRQLEEVLGATRKIERRINSRMYVSRTNVVEESLKR